MAVVRQLVMPEYGGLPIRT